MKSGEDWGPTFEINTTAVSNVSATFLHLLDAGNKRRGWESGKMEPGGGPRGRNWKEAARAGLGEDDERMSQIVTIASISGFNRHITAGLAYTASKAGAVLLGKSMATFLAPWGVRSNVIAPGSTSYPFPAFSEQFCEAFATFMCEILITFLHSLPV